jgi:hypothetical protein
MTKSAPAAKLNRPDRRVLCDKLPALHLKHADVFARIDSLKADLIELATEAGEGFSFREVFADRGQVSVSGAKGREFKGHVPEIEPKIFNALSEVKRQKLIDAGIVKIVPYYTRQYHGRVDVKTF